MAAKKTLWKAFIFFLVHVKQNNNSDMIIKMLYPLYFVILTLLSHAIDITTYY